MPGEMSSLAETNVINTQLDTGQMEMTTIVGAVKDSGAIDVILEEDGQDDKTTVKVHADTKKNKAKCHQETQTNLFTLLVADVIPCEPNDEPQGLSERVKYTNKY